MAARPRVRGLDLEDAQPAAVVFVSWNRAIEMLQVAFTALLFVGERWGYYEIAFDKYLV